jgi:hypothetical protein
VQNDIDLHSSKSAMERFQEKAPIHERMDEKNAQKAELEKKIAEAEETFRAVLDTVFGSEAGELFGRELVRQLGVFESNSCTNPTLMVEENARRGVYLKLIRPYLTEERRQKLEK